MAAPPITSTLSTPMTASATTMVRSATANVAAAGAPRYGYASRWALRAGGGGEAGDGAGRAGAQQVGTVTAPGWPWGQQRRWPQTCPRRWPLHSICRFGTTIPMMGALSPPAPGDQDNGRQPNLRQPRELRLHGDISEQKKPRARHLGVRSWSGTLGMAPRSTKHRPLQRVPPTSSTADAASSRPATRRGCSRWRKPGSHRAPRS